MVHRNALAALLIAGLSACSSGESPRTGAGPAAVPEPSELLVPAGGRPSGGAAPVAQPKTPARATTGRRAQVEPAGSSEPPAGSTVSGVAGDQTQVAPLETTTTTEPSARATTTSTVAPKAWVEVARFEWTAPVDDIMRQQVDLRTGMIRVRTSYDWDRLHAGNSYGYPPEAAWWSDDGAKAPTEGGCRPKADNPGTVIYSKPTTSQDGQQCGAFEGPWPTGQRWISFGVAPENSPRRGPVSSDPSWVVVEELRQQN